MNYIVLDMEWNQPFDTKHMVKTPLALHGEIFEIGAVKLDEKLSIVDNFRITIRPAYYKKMHRSVVKLTGTTTEDLQYGFEFPVAFRYFENWCGGDFVFLTWGDDDIYMLRDNMKLHNLDADWIPQSYNVQRIFNNQITKDDRSISLTKAMEIIGGDMLKAHKALNDATNTVLICQKLDMDKGIADYHKIKIKINTNLQYTAIQSEYMIYPSKEAAFSDNDLTDFYCADFGENIVCSGIIKQSTDKYICIGKCESGREPLVRFKFRKHSKGALRVSRLVYEKDEAMMEYYFKIKEKTEKKVLCSQLQVCQ